MIYLRDELWSQNIAPLGSAIRHHPDLRADGGANVNFVAFSRYTPLGLDGQVISLFVIVLAAAEAAVALAIALNFYNNHQTIDVDRGDQLHG